MTHLARSKIISPKSKGQTIINNTVNSTTINESNSIHRMPAYISGHAFIVHSLDICDSTINWYPLIDLTNFTVVNMGGYAHDVLTAAIAVVRIRGEANVYSKFDPSRPARKRARFGIFRKYSSGNISVECLRR